MASEYVAGHTAIRLPAGVYRGKDTVRSRHSPIVSAHSSRRLLNRCRTDPRPIYIEKFIEHAKSHPEEYPQSEAYLPLLRDGSLTVEIDKDYPKAIVTKQLAEHQWGLYHQEWHVIQNETDELFLTSDNPSCFDYVYGSAMHPASYLPLTPRLALWANIDTSNIPPITDPTIPPARKSEGHKAIPKFVREMNILVIKSAENLVLSSVPKAYIRACVEKYRDWWVSKADIIRIPDEDGYYEVVQTRALPKGAAV
jgi:hypothetical protein